MSVTLIETSSRSITSGPPGDINLLPDRQPPPLVECCCLVAALAVHALLVARPRFSLGGGIRRARRAQVVVGHRHLQRVPLGAIGAGHALVRPLVPRTVPLLGHALTAPEVSARGHGRGAPAVHALIIARPLGRLGGRVGRVDRAQVVVGHRVERVLPPTPGGGDALVRPLVPRAEPLLGHALAARQVRARRRGRGRAPALVAAGKLQASGRLCGRVGRADRTRRLVRRNKRLQRVIMLAVVGGNAHARPVIPRAVMLVLLGHAVAARQRRTSICDGGRAGRRGRSGRRGDSSRSSGLAGGCRCGGSRGDSR